MATLAPPKTDRLGDDLGGLDALEESKSRVRGGWSSVWPKLAALVLAFAIWQVVVWAHWKPEYVLPGPGAVLRRLGSDLTNGVIPRATLTTMRRAIEGYTIALLIGTVIGAAVARQRVLRAAFGSMISGLQSMPSIAWFPLAILIFKLSEGAIMAVILLGAAPSIANGVISGVDHVPPTLIRAGRVLGARGLQAYWHVILPAALPGFVAGLKQGWSFAWRSLMAGELLVIVANQPSLGSRLQFARDTADAEGLLAVMLVVLVIGIVIDAAVFGTIERSIRRRRGLLVSS
jgi:NitT/TauT family transport system permease protein